jgi:hypothetical protein
MISQQIKRRVSLSGDFALPKHQEKNGNVKKALCQVVAQLFGKPPAKNQPDPPETD